MTMTDAAARRIAMRITNKYRTLCSARARLMRPLADGHLGGFRKCARTRRRPARNNAAIKLNCKRAAFHQIAAINICRHDVAQDDRFIIAINHSARARVLHFKVNLNNARIYI